MANLGKFHDSWKGSFLILFISHFFNLWTSWRVETSKQRTVGLLPDSILLQCVTFKVKSTSLVSSHCKTENVTAWLHFKRETCCIFKFEILISNPVCLPCIACFCAWLKIVLWFEFTMHNRTLSIIWAIPTEMPGVFKHRDQDKDESFFTSSVSCLLITVGSTWTARLFAASRPWSVADKTDR